MLEVLKALDLEALEVMEALEVLRVPIRPKRLHNLLLMDLQDRYRSFALTLMSSYTSTN